jgi:very-short-patch-repair endonuclease
MTEANQTVPQRTTAAYSRLAFTRADLLDQGLSRRGIALAVQHGHLQHVRRDRYLLTAVDPDVVEAVRIGGRLTCLSLFAVMGVFVHRRRGLHVFVTRGSSRLRPPKVPQVTYHWNRSSALPELLHVAPLIDAARHAVRCQEPRAAVATLDSLVHHGLLTSSQLDEVFAGLPARLRPTRTLVDGSAESGPETFVRLMLRTIGVRFETQVFIPGVGRVDFVVEGWLIIECDSKEFHEGWQKQQEDRRRDLAAARRGYVTIRPLATDVLGAWQAVQAALREVIETLGPSFIGSRRAQFSKNSGR